MESYDDLTYGTSNPEMSLLLSSHQWEHIPKDLYELYRQKLKKMTSLSLSHLKLSSVSEHIQQLTLLQELNLSHNEIETLPKEIGQQCIMLRSLLLNDNSLVSLPDLALPALETLDLRNNHLRTISSKLSTIETLRNIPCDGNSELDTIPVDMRSNSALVLWTLRLQDTYHAKIDDKMQKYQEIEAIAKTTELEKLHLNHELKKLKNFVNHLHRERPLKWMQIKGRALKWKSKSRERFVGGIQWVKQLLFSRKREKISSREQELVCE